MNAAANDAAVQLLRQIERELHHSRTVLSAMLTEITDPTTREPVRKAMVELGKLRNQIEDLLLDAVDDEAIP
jgi:hypothetical protein